MRGSFKVGDIIPDTRRARSFACPEPTAMRSDQTALGLGDRRNAFARYDPIVRTRWRQDADDNQRYVRGDAGDARRVHGDSAYDFHDYGGEVAPNPILAVEDGRRVSFAQLLVQDNRIPAEAAHPQVVLVERRKYATTRPDELPVWTGRGDLCDQSFLKRWTESAPQWRCPEAIRDAVENEPSMIRWDAGYVVATRPFTVAYPTDARAFQMALYPLAVQARTTQPATTLPVLRNTIRPLIISPNQQYSFGLAWVEPIALGERVDTPQIREDTDTLRVVRLDAPMTIDALLNLLASPGGIESHVAEELRQARPMSDLERAVRQRDASAIPRL